MFKILFITSFLLLTIITSLNAEDRIIQQSGTFNLMWQDTAEVKNTKKDYDTALSYCENLILGGFTDWRIPLVEELLYISDKKTVSPSIHSAFINTASDEYWSSTAYPNGSSSYYEYFTVDFKNGNDTGAHDNHEHYVRCVRGEKATLNFSRDSATSIVSESKTGLMFQDDSSTGANKFTLADSKCKNSELGAYSDWRVPTFEELYLLLNNSTSYSLVENIFEKTSTNYTWTSDKYLSYSGSYWFVRFSTAYGWGFDNSKAQNSNYSVKCVRGNHLEFNFSLYGSSSNIQVTNSVKHELKSGWSMISSIINGKKYSTSLFDASVVYSYNPKTSSFYNPEHCKPSVGCWVKLLSDRTVTLDASNLENDSTMSLKSIINESEPNAWNLVGTSIDTTLSELKKLNVSSVWTYDTSTGVWNNNETVKAGEGFWIKTLNSSSSSQSSSSSSESTSSSVSSSSEIVDDSIVNSASDMPVISSGIIKKVEAGDDHTLVLKSNGELWGFGSNQYGQLGDGSTKTRLSPVKIMQDVKDINVYKNSSFAIKTDNSLWGFGKNNGRLGDGTLSSKANPVKIMENVSSINRLLIIKMDGTLWTIADDGLSYTKFMDNVRYATEAGGSFAIKTDGTLWAWGLNLQSQLGVGSNRNIALPIKIMSNVKSVLPNYYNTYVVKTDGTLWGMGLDDTGIFGEKKSLPFKIMDDVDSISATNSVAIALKNDKSAWGFGYNTYGKLGLGNITNTAVPIKIMDDVKNLNVTFGSSFIQKIDNTLWGFGRNDRGQLGDGTTTQVLTPKKLYDDVKLFETTSYRSHVLKNNGTLWGSGGDGVGLLGSGHSSVRESVQIQTKPLRYFPDIKGIKLYNQNSSGIDFKMLTNNDKVLYGNIKDGKLNSFTTFPKELNGGALVFQSENNKVKYIYEISSKATNSILEVKDGYFDVFTHDSIANTIKYEGKQEYSTKQIVATVPSSSTSSSSSSSSSSVSPTAVILSGERVDSKDDGKIYKSSVKSTRILPLWIAVIGLGYTVYTIDAILDEANNIVNGEQTIVDRLKELNDDLANLPSIIEDYFRDRYDNLLSRAESLGAEEPETDSTQNTTPVKTIFDFVPRITIKAKEFFNTSSTEPQIIASGEPSSTVSKGTCFYITSYSGTKHRVYPGTAIASGYFKDSYAYESNVRIGAWNNAGNKIIDICHSVARNSGPVFLLPRETSYKQATCNDLSGRWVDKFECSISSVEAYCSCPVVYSGSSR